MSNKNQIFLDRATYSRTRLKELGTRLSNLPEIKPFEELTVFGAGSYGRLEASEHSDIDIFFLNNQGKDDAPNPRETTFRLFGKVIETVDTMRFPKLSNDCEYLVLLNAQDLLSNLGSRVDDHQNFFTIRMLLLLESACLLGKDVYDEIVKGIVDSYFKGRIQNSNATPRRGPRTSAGVR